MTYIVLDEQLEAKVRMGERLTQREEVLVMLRDGHGYGVCGTVFLQAYIPRYSARIGELRKEGWEITKRKCVNLHHNHGRTPPTNRPGPKPKQSHQFEYVLGVPADPTLF